jgi:RimJ/RimL family protein N-acetyltransferase
MVTDPPFDIQPALEGEKVILRPLRGEDFDALFAVASDPEIWAQHPYRDRYKLEVFRGFFDQAMASKGAFAILDRATSQIIGSSRFSNYDPNSNEIEIGWTFYATSYWRNGTNREIKALMLRHVFPHIEAVLFQIGANNHRSRTAVERLGAKLVREHQREHGGKVHDYVTYRLTEADAARGALALRVENV